MRVTLKKPRLTAEMRALVTYRINRFSLPFPKMRPVQRLDLEAGEAEHKIHRKPLGIALDLLVEALGGDSAERGEYGIEQHPLTAQHEDDAGDVLNRYRGRALHRDPGLLWPNRGSSDPLQSSSYCSASRSSSLTKSRTSSRLHSCASSSACSSVARCTRSATARTVGGQDCSPMMMSLSSSRHSSTVASPRVCANDIAATPSCESLAATIHEQGPERATPAQPVPHF